jgi:hypothetical protein
VWGLSSDCISRSIYRKIDNRASRFVIAAGTENCSLKRS